MLTGLVLAVPELDGFVAAYRHASDLGQGIPAHVTALFPWLPGPLADPVLARLGDVVRGFGPVTMSFRRVATFPAGVVHLVPEPQQRLRELTRLLVGAYPTCPPYGGEHPDPEPHLTVTTVPVDQLDKVAARVARDLVPVHCTVDTLTALEQLPDGSWRTVRQLPLG